MEVHTTPGPEDGKGKGFKAFAAIRIVAAITVTVAALWLISYLIGYFDKGNGDRLAHLPAAGEKADMTAAHGSADAETTGHSDTATHEAGTTGGFAQSSHDAEPVQGTGSDHRATGGHEAAATPATTHGETAAAPHAKAAEKEVSVGDKGLVDSHSTTAAKENTAPDADAHGEAVPAEPLTKGVAFMNAFIAPMNFEVNDRFWGWRPNDIIEFTDNVNNYQLGVLETTRRTIEVLHEHISRTGSTQAHNRHLVNARNNFMINADAYMLPSAEGSYEEALDSLRKYKEQLENGTAFFYTRTANLLPLLRAYEYLLGSCDDNLVKTHEEDGKPVSFFRADDYFYYAKGVADAMHSILEAVAIDFSKTIEPRRGTEVLHHAIEALEHAKHVHPILILNSGSSSLLANHRLNLAGPISHARFYVGLLIETLST